MTILIKNGTIITIDKNFSIIRKGAIFLDQDRIVDIGFTDVLVPKYSSADQIIDANGKIIMPGFVSAHNHLGYTLYRGMAEDVGPKPTPSLFLPMKQLITQLDRKTFSALGATELLRGGVTTILEMEEDAQIVAPFIEQIGVRAGVAVMANDVDVNALMQGQTVFSKSMRDQQLKQTEDLIRIWHGKANGLITAFVAANMALSCSPQLLKGLRKLADKYQVGLTYHVGLGAYEVDLIQSLYGCRPFEFARNVGFLTEKSIVAHCHYMNDDDMTILQRSSASVVHCPVLNSLRAASADIYEMRQRGIPLSLGLDNYFADYFDVMRACISVARVKSKNATFLSARDVLRFATIDGAKAMGLNEHVGSLEIGKKADLQLINLNQLGTCPVTDPASTLVYHAHSHNVDMVMINGKILVLQGKVLSVDQDALIEQAQLAADVLWARFAQTYPNLIGEKGCQIQTPVIV